MKKFQWIFPILITISAILWGMDGVVLRPTLYSLPVLTVVFLEHALAFIIMIPLLFAERKELKKISKKSFFYFFLTALFGGAIGTICITKGLFYVNFTHLSAVVLMQKLQPIFAIFLAWLILKEKLPRKFFIYAFIALFGAYLIAFPTLIPNFNTGNKTTVGAIFGLLAALSWGASTVFSKRALLETNFRVGTYLRYGLTSLIVFLMIMITGGHVTVSAVSHTQWLYFLIIILSSGVLAMLLYYFGLKHTKASVSTICELGLPLSSIIFEWFIYHKTLNITQFIGVALLLVAIIMVSRMKEATTEQ